MWNFTTEEFAKELAHKLEKESADVVASVHPFMDGFVVAYSLYAPMESQDTKVQIILTSVCIERKQLDLL